MRWQLPLPPRNCVSAHDAVSAGVMKFADGRIYNGWWHTNKMEGPGVMVHPDGRRQEGMWKDDKFEGKMQPGPADASNTKPRPK